MKRSGIRDAAGFPDSSLVGLHPGYKQYKRTHLKNDF
jgi:hypothetical protein